MLIFDENVRRMKEMSQLNPLAASYVSEDKQRPTLVVNRNSTAVKNLLKMASGLAPDATKLRMMVEQIYDLAYIQHGRFSSTEMQAFIERSALLLGGFGSTSLDV